MARHAKKTSYKMDPFALTGTIAIAILCLASLSAGFTAMMRSSNGLDAQNMTVVIVSMVITAVIAATGAAFFLASRTTKRIAR